MTVQIMNGLKLNFENVIAVGTSALSEFKNLDPRKTINESTRIGYEFNLKLSE